jgi:hypothetical protein
MNLYDKKEEVIELARRLNNTYYASWPKFGTYINSIIQSKNFDQLRKPLHLKQWSKIFNGELKYNYDWWCELEEVLLEIKASKENRNTNKIKSFIHINNEHRIENVNYAVAKLQDTIIPFLYKAAYNLSFSKNVIFQLNYDWSKCLEKIITSDIDVAIHNFPTVLAYSKHMQGKNNMFFFPFFTFSGYGLCIKKASLKEFVGPNKDVFIFDDLDLNEKKHFLESAKIVLERNSDFEWALKTFCEKFQCDWSIVSSNIIDAEINDGKLSFLENPSINIYSTNSIHIADLKTKNSIEVIENFTGHHNYNGIMCTMDYYMKNTEIVHGLINIWFNNIKLFLNDLRIIKKTKINKDLANFHISALLDKLNDLTFSNVTIMDFINSYENNFFFQSPINAKESFINNVLSNEQAIKKYMEIAEIQLNNSEYSTNITENRIREQIDFTRNQLKKIIIKY